MNSNDRYAPVGAALPPSLPSINRVEATRAALRICKHFGKVRDGGPSQHYDVMPYDTRRCWLSPVATSATNHDKGWGRLIHDMSHWIFHKRHPRFRSHAGGHATLEREIAEWVTAKGYFAGTLKPKVKAKPSRDEARALRLKRMETNLARWDAKLRRAQTAIKKLKRQHRAMTRAISKESTV